MGSDSIIDWVQLIAQNTWLYGGTFLLVLGILVFVHEWGHYIVARICGVKVETFSIGFGPELFGFNDKNDTRWKFSLIPLGGYVQMFGDSDPASTRITEDIRLGSDEAEEAAESGETVRPMNPEERKVAFFTQPVWQRALIVFAGPAINYIFAVFLFAGLYVFYGQPVTPSFSAGIMEGSAAEEAGFLPHDEIISIDGKKLRRFEDLRREVTVGLNAERAFEVRRNNEVITINATPDRKEMEDHFGFKHSRGQLGVVSPANGISLKSIKSINGVKYETLDAVRNALQNSMGQQIRIGLPNADDGEDILIVHPLRENNAQIYKANPKPEDLFLVLSKDDEEILIKYNPIEAVGAAVQETINVTKSTLDALWQMISGTRSAKELGGIIRIGAIAGDMAKAGILSLISFTALLSINLGLINLFPIPMLDGGHLMFYAVETAKGSPISERGQEYSFRLGLVILIALMLFSNLNDILQIVL